MACAVIPGIPQAPEPLHDYTGEDTALLDTRLDEYPMPDNDFTAEDLERDYGYLDGAMLPVSKDQAEEIILKELIYSIILVG